MPVGPTGNNAAIQSVAMQDLHSVTSTRSSRTLWTLRASGSTNLASASQCSLSFLRLREHGFRPCRAAQQLNNGEAEEAQVVMHGTLRLLRQGLCMP
jgi:hypothetical protein